MSKSFKQSTNVLVLILIILGFAFVSPAYAARAKQKGVLCSSATGALVVRLARKCKRNESLIDIAALEQITPASIGPQGPKGDDGVDGQEGAPGLDGVSGYELVETEVTTTLTPGQNISPVAMCPIGKKILGGGCQSDFFAVEVIQNSILEVATDTFAYRCTFNSKSGSLVTTTLRVSATCVTTND